jgi:secreted PhoX family phosphatase
MSFENVVAHPGAGNMTVVAETDDAGGGQVYFHYGTKQATGNAVERLGLTGGTLYGLAVDGVPTEPAGAYSTTGTRFSLVSLGDVTNTTGAQLQTESVAAGVTGFQRPEDASWDPTNPNVLYFVTTNGFNAPSRLWRATFDDVTNPAAGGTIETVLAGSEGQQMLDNITVNDRGQVLLQEDPGNQSYIARLWLYDYATDSLMEIAKHDPERFAPNGLAFLTQDEESSGIIPAPFLGSGKYLLDVQAHYSLPGELVQGGQLLTISVPPGKFPKH